MRVQRIPPGKNKSKSQKQPVIKRRTFLKAAGVTLAGSAVGGLICQLTESEEPQIVPAKPSPLQNLARQRVEEIRALIRFFERRQSQMKNTIDPGNFNPTIWATVAFNGGWRIAQLRIIEKVATEKLFSCPWVNSTLGFWVAQMRYRPFIATEPADRLPGKPQIFLNINYKVLPLTKAEWADLFDHELNHTRLQRTDVILKNAYPQNHLHLLQYWLNFFNLARMLLPQREISHFNELAQRFMKIYVGEGATPAQALADLGAFIDEILADAMIDPITNVTRSRYQKLINHLIKSNVSLGTAWVGRVEAVGKLLAAPIDIKAAEKKMVGNPALRKIVGEIAEIIFDLRSKLIGRLIFESKMDLFTFKK